MCHYWHFTCRNTTMAVKWMSLCSLNGLDWEQNPGLWCCKRGWWEIPKGMTFKWISVWGKSSKWAALGIKQVLSELWASTTSAHARQALNGSSQKTDLSCFTSCGLHPYWEVMSEHVTQSQNLSEFPGKFTYQPSAEKWMKSFLWFFMKGPECKCSTTSLRSIFLKQQSSWPMVGGRSNIQKLS